jgi:hypothetical protein
MIKPRIVTLCGSTKFREAFEAANRRLTLEGVIVLSVGCFGHCGDPLSLHQKTELDALHFRKIEMSDSIFVLNVNGYIGESTTNEIAYAFSLGKGVDFYQPKCGETWLEENKHPLRQKIAVRIQSNAYESWKNRGCDLCGFGSVEDCDKFDPYKPCPECGVIKSAF